AGGAEPAAAGLPVPAAREPAAGRARLASAPGRLPVPVFHELDRLQSDRCDAADAPGETVDADRLVRLGDRLPPRRGALSQHLQVGAGELVPNARPTVRPEIPLGAAPDPEHDPLAAAV